MLLEGLEEFEELRVDCMALLLEPATEERATDPLPPADVEPLDTPPTLLARVPGAAVRAPTEPPLPNVPLLSAVDEMVLPPNRPLGTLV